MDLTLTLERPPNFDPRDRPLDGSVALVTGGGRGIGRRLAQRLALAGAAVGLVARSSDELAESVRLIEATGGTAAAVTADVTDHDDIAEAVSCLRSTLGPIDLLVNNAGVTGPIGPLWEVDPASWWNAMDVNVQGTLVTIQAVLAEMVARRRGRIINLSSQAGVHRWPLVSAYSVSKAAVTKLSENLAHETRQFGVSVFSVHPGLLPMGMTDSVTAHAPANEYEEHIQQWVAKELRDGRGADPERAIELMVRLAAGDGDALSGRHISVHDDLDALVASAAEIARRDLYVLRPEPLPTARRASSSPPYYLGRPAHTWRRALTRS
jgi:NAD(P)-dependent dehydrogenase (short-subunit alcohol dehydrogenase family)